MINDLLEVVLENEPLIYSVINKYKNYFDKDDLFQVGRIALINAYKNYDAKSSAKFSSYAYFYILGEVNKYIRESNFFKVSKDLSRLNKKINESKEMLSQRLGRYPSDAELANFLELDISVINDAKMSSLIVSSLDKEDSELSFYDTCGYEESSYDASILDLKNEVSNLDPLSKSIIENRYMLGNTQSETSKNLGITQVMVSRKEKEILQRLRTRLK